MQLDPWFATALLALINVVAFCAQGLDKWRAKRAATRISERTLLLLGLPLGALGMWLGMLVFRHKTGKSSFIAWAVLTTFGNAALVASIVWAVRNEHLVLERVHVP